jgi:hypothetical protein
LGAKTHVVDEGHFVHAVRRSTIHVANRLKPGRLRAMQLPRFEDLAASADTTLDLLALALAAAFSPVDAARAPSTLDDLGEEVAGVLARIVR